jgi:hypothetical protein
MNKLKTTINFTSERFSNLLDFAESSGIAYKKLIKIYLEQFVIHFTKTEFEETTLRYQEENKDWKKVHFSMSREEYDVYFDCKKVSRMSFSLIVAIAIDTYADDILNAHLEDSYPLTTYTKICLLENNYPIYLFCWKKIEKKEIISAIKTE